MNELMKVFGQVSGTQQFDLIRISIASPERVRSWFMPACTLFLMHADTSVKRN